MAEMEEMEEMETGAAVVVVNSGAAVVEVNSGAAVVEAGLAMAWCRRTTTGKEKPAGQVHSLQWSSGNLFGRACTLIRRATHDHQLPGQDFKRRKSTGKGTWKTWTPEAVLRVGFGNETATCRQLANEVETFHLCRSCPGLAICSSFYLWPGCKSCLGQFARVIGNFERSGTFFGPLVWKFGPVAQWPQPRRRIVRKAVMVMTWQLARKLVLPW